MSSGIIKGVLITGIVFGLESLLWGGLFLFRKDRLRAAKSLGRAGLTILFSLLGYYLFSEGYFRDFSYTSALIFSMVCSAVVVLIEIALHRGFEVRSSQPLTEIEWRQKKFTKRQFFLFLFSMFAPLPGVATPAIVFSLVAPEVLELHWWLVLIVTITLIYVVFALREWNAHETKFGSQTIKSD